MVFSENSVLSVCGTPYILYSRYAVLGVSCTLCQSRIIIWRNGQRRFNLVFCDHSRVMDMKQRCVINMKTMCSMWADMRYEGYNMPDWVRKTLDLCYYMLYWNFYLLYPVCLIHLSTEISEVTVSD